MFNKFLSILISSLFVSSALLGSPGTNDRAPEIQLPFVDGSSESIAKVYPGETHTVLEFSAYACKWCRLGMPTLNDLAQRLVGKATVKIITPDSKEKSKKFLQELGINLPTAYDVDFLAFDAYGVTLTPHTFVIDQSGLIVFTHQDKELTQEVADHIYNIVNGN